MASSDIRYKRLGYVALNVSDVATSFKFYTEIVGLAGEMSDGVAFLRCSDRHHDIVMTGGETPGLKRIGWQMESPAALVAAREHFQAIGLAVNPVSNSETAALGISEAFRMREPTTGAMFEFYVEMDPAPEPYVRTHTMIERLGHVVLNSPKRPETEAFMLDHMNFRVSDRIGDGVAFMRCFPNPLHHSFAVGRGTDSQLHHVNFMVTEMADIGKGLNRMKRNKVPIVYGPGKHPPSESVFLYFLDPDRITLEYSYGMEEFPEVDPREARAMPPSLESIDYWEGTPEPEFAKTGVVERTDA